MDITQRIKSSNLDKARQANRTFELRLRDNLEDIAHARCLALYAITRESTNLLVENQQRNNERFNLSLRRSLESAPSGRRETLADSGRRCSTSDGPWQAGRASSFGVKIHNGNEGSSQAYKDDFEKRTRKPNLKSVTFYKPSEFDRNTTRRVGFRITPKDGKVRNDQIVDVRKARQGRNDASSFQHPSGRKSSVRKDASGHFKQDNRSPKRSGLNPSQRKLVRFCTLFSSSNSHRQQNQGLEEGTTRPRPPRRRLGLAAALGTQDEEQAVLLRLRRLSQARENAALEERVRDFLSAKVTDGETMQMKPLVRRSSSVIPQDEDERLLEMFKNLVLPRNSLVRSQALQSP